MKKIVLGLCFMAMIFTLIGCSQKPDIITPLKVGDAISSEGILEGKLIDIQFGKTIEPPSPKAYTVYNARTNKNEGKLFMDFIFQLKNLKQKDMDLYKDFRLEVKSGEDILTIATVDIESETGENFTKNTLLTPGEQGIVHLGVEIPSAITDFTVSITIGKTLYEMTIDKTKVLEGRTMAELDKPFMIEDIGELTLNLQEYTDKIIPDETQNLVVMGYEQKDSTKTFLHFKGLVSQLKIEKVEEVSHAWVQYEDGQRFNGILVEGHNNDETDDTKILHIIIEVPKDVVSKPVELVLYQGGNYYHYKAGVIQ